MSENGHSSPAWIIVNPRSGSVRARPRMAADLWRAGGEDVEVHATLDLDHLDEVCRRAAARGVRRIGCVGGDGTTSAVASAVVRAYGDRPLPVLALLRGGTNDTVARCLGVPYASPAKLLRRWLERPARAVRRTPLEVDGHIGFLFGVGLFPNWLQAYYDAGHGHPTRRTAARLTLRTALSTLYGGALGKRVLAPVHAEVETDGECWNAEPYYSLMAGAVDEVGLSFRVFPHATDDPDRVDLIALRSPGWKLAMALPEMLVTRSGLPPQIHDEHLVHSAVMRSTNGPLTYALDGDLHETQGALKLTRGPALDIADLS